MSTRSRAASARICAVTSRIPAEARETMTDVDRLLREYIEEHRAGGEADPLAYVERLEGTDRAELEALIDAYLARAPGRDWDPEAYRGSQSRPGARARKASMSASDRKSTRLNS